MPAIAEAETAGIRRVSPPPPRLELAGVTIRYKAAGRLVTAAEGIDLRLEAGERLVLLGPSGCGKSSLLKAIAGHLRPTAGRILVDGREVRRPGPDRAVVFQEFDQLLPWRTVRGNVVFALRAALNLPRDEAVALADQAIAQVGLARFAGAYPHTLSGGMKQRVAIARSLVLKPRILLMDEPFAALDALTRSRMQEDLLSLWMVERFTLFFVTHSIDEAVRLGDRVVVLSAHPGRVREIIDLHGGEVGTSISTVRDRIHALLMDGHADYQI